MSKSKTPAKRARTRTYTPEELLAMPRSKLLRLAVAGMRAARKRGYRLDMNTWYEPRRGKKPCTVCMAGAVLAFSLRETDRSEFLRDGAYAPTNLCLAMRRVDEMRRGFIPALDDYDYGNEKTKKALNAAGDVINAAYSGGRATDAAYLRAAKILADAGL